MNEAEIGAIAFVAVLIAFYLVLIRPMQREQSKQRKDIKDLQVGDEVLTTSGFIGTVKEIYLPESGPTQIVIDFGNGVVISGLPSAIAQRVAAGQTLHSGSLGDLGQQEKGTS